MCKHYNYISEITKKKKHTSTLKMALFFQIKILSTAQSFVQHSTALLFNHLTQACSILYLYRNSQHRH